MTNYIYLGYVSRFTYGKSTDTDIYSTAAGGPSRTIRSVNREFPNNSDKHSILHNSCFTAVIHGKFAYLLIAHILIELLYLGDKSSDIWRPNQSPE